MKWISKDGEKKKKWKSGWCVAHRKERPMKRWFGLLKLNGVWGLHREEAG